MRSTHPDAWPHSSACSNQEGPQYSSCTIHAKNSTIQQSSQFTPSPACWQEGRLVRIHHTDSSLV